MDNLQPLLTLDETADILRMSVSWVKREIALGHLKQVKLGKMVRVEIEDLRSFIADCKRRSAVEEIVTTLSIQGASAADTALMRFAVKHTIDDGDR